jgi:hypothetical protein
LSSTSTGSPWPPSQTKQLLELAQNFDVFHDAEGHAFAAYDVVRPGVPAHRETWPLGAKPGQVVRDLTSLFFHAYGSAPHPNVRGSVLDALAARAHCIGPERPVFRRVAEYDGAIYIDLCNGAWEAVRVTPDGWTIVTTANLPVYFTRAKGMEALPRPERGGSLDELRAFVNVVSDDDWRLIVAWWAMCLRPRGPYPVLIVHGGEGTAKTTLCRILRALIDPNQAALRSAPRNEQDLMIAALNGRLIALDNLSVLTPWLSDALCRLTTDGSFATRALYTAEDETLITAQRPVLINGIEQIAGRADFLNRCVVVRLSVIPEHARRAESELWPAFEKARPRIFGAMCDALAGALRELPGVHLARRPRMADFAEWATAIERTLGWRHDAFIDAYARNLTQGSEEVIAADPLAAAICRLVETEPWQGTATELLDALDDRQTVVPDTPAAMSNSLVRIEGALARVGIVVTRPQRTSGARPIRIERVEKVGGTDADAA